MDQTDATGATLQNGQVPPAASCPTCDGAADRAFVYALGRIEPRFPSAGIEKEFIQATSRASVSGKTDRQAMHAVLTHQDTRYLLRQMAWVFSVEGMETYILRPRDSSDLDLLAQALRETPRLTDVDVIIGTRGSLAPPTMCNGLVVPMVTVDQVYSFDVDSLISAIPRPDTISADAFKPAAEELFQRLVQMADNAGGTDEHRALNYLAVRYPSIYTTAAEAFGRNASLSAVEVRPSRLSGLRKVVQVIFSYTDRTTDVTEKSFTRVDVTEMFPFLVSKLQPFLEREG